MPRKSKQKVGNGKAAHVDATSREAMEATFKAAVFGEIMSVLLRSPRHNNVTLGTVSRQLVPAFLTGQYVLARAKSDRSDRPPTPIGVAFWAGVSDDVDKRLTESPQGPIQLTPDEWRGGDNIWLMDIIAAPNISNALVKSIRQKVGGAKTIKIRSSAPDGTPITKTIAE